MTTLAARNVSPGINRSRVTRPRVVPLSICFGTILSLAILGPVMSDKPAPFSGEGSPLRQVFYLGVFLAVIWAVRPVQWPRRLLSVPWPLVAGVAYCWLSLTWALEPGIAARRLMLTTILIWTLFTAVSQIGYRKTITIMRAVLLACMAANYMAAVLFPQVGVHQAVAVGDANLVGDWRGIMLQKNFAGIACVVLIYLFVFDARAIRKTVRIAVIAAAGFFLYKTGSKTSAGLLMIGMGGGFAYARYNPTYRALLVPAALCLTVGLAIAGIQYTEGMLASLNDPSALTGRAQIWPLMIAYSHDHLLLGAGYGSFWNIGVQSGPVFEYGKGWVTDQGNGHNGYLDLLVQIGMPGLLLIVFATILWPVAMLLSSRTIPRQRGAFMVAMIIFCAGHNGTESSLFDRDTLVQVFLMVAIALIPYAPVNDRSLPTPRPRSR